MKIEVLKDGNVMKLSAVKKAVNFNELENKSEILEKIRIAYSNVLTEFQLTMTKVATKEPEKIGVVAKVIADANENLQRLTKKPKTQRVSVRTIALDWLLQNPGATRSDLVDYLRTTYPKWDIVSKIITVNSIFKSAAAEQYKDTIFKSRDARLVSMGYWNVFVPSEDVEDENAHMYLIKDADFKENMKLEEGIKIAKSYVTKKSNK